MFFGSKCVKVAKMCKIHIYTQLCKGWCECSNAPYNTFTIYMVSSKKRKPHVLKQEGSKRSVHKLKSSGVS